MHSPFSLPSDMPPASRRLALKIDVDSVRGASQGVPALIDLLRRYAANASFLFSLGPDRSGRSLRALVRASLDRTTHGVTPYERYGLKGFLHGTLLPAPAIGERAETSVRAARAAGFEVGLRPWDGHAWRRLAADADAAWTQAQMQRAFDRFVQLVGAPPRMHGACGWQMNRHAFRLTQRLGFDYCSDTRGLRPYVPVIDAEIIACPQIPTTLPTFDELLADPAVDRQSVADRMVDAFAATAAPQGHVLALRADGEGIALLPAFERFVERLHGQGVTFMALGEYLAAADTTELPRHRVQAVETPGLAPPPAMQFNEFLA
jgi:peptidoglycan/xylan/chitin deacetylase (PgdA/CDA1 family)